MEVQPRAIMADFEILYGGELRQLREVYHISIAAYNDLQLIDLLSTHRGSIEGVLGNIRPNAEVQNNVL